MKPQPTTSEKWVWFWQGVALIVATGLFVMVFGIPYFAQAATYTHSDMGFDPFGAPSGYTEPTIFSGATNGFVGVFTVGEYITISGTSQMNGIWEIKNIGHWSDYDQDYMEVNRFYEEYPVTATLISFSTTTATTTCSTSTMATTTLYVGGFSYGEVTIAFFLLLIFSLLFFSEVRNMIFKNGVVVRVIKEYDRKG